MPILFIVIEEGLISQNYLFFTLFSQLHEINFKYILSYICVLLCGIWQIGTFNKRVNKANVATLTESMHHKHTYIPAHLFFHSRLHQTLLLLSSSLIHIVMGMSCCEHLQKETLMSQRQCFQTGSLQHAGDLTWIRDWPGEKNNTVCQSGACCLCVKFCQWPGRWTFPWGKLSHKVTAAFL